jgi:hypothetical protein
MKKTILFIALTLFTACYHGKPIKVLPEAKAVPVRTLFIALDGIDHKLMKELKDEGHFRAFYSPIPLISTFPSATTIGFTGIYQPLKVGKVAGYEARFYSHQENKIMGGTPLDVYKTPIKYKYYFDSFRHTMQEKSVMYLFPSMASKQDLVSTQNVLFANDKNILMTYLGGTDGSAHILGRGRTKRTLIFMDQFLNRLVRKYYQERNERLRIILFSDHGFKYTNLKLVSNKAITKGLEAAGFRSSTKIDDDNDIVFVKFGMISGGVAFANKKNRKEMANIIRKVDGMDLVFWHNDNERKVFIHSTDGKQAYFEYRGKKLYRYVNVSGDPLNYLPTLNKLGYDSKTWLKDKTWKQITHDHHYPDAGYRLFDGFFHLVKNNAGIMFSLKGNYQFGSTAAYVGTFSRIGQRGTHGALFKQASYAFAMTNMHQSKNPPSFLRYDELFPHYIPDVTQAYKKQKKGKPDFVSLEISHESFETKLLGLEMLLLGE